MRLSRTDLLAAVFGVATVAAVAYGLREETVSTPREFHESDFRPPVEHPAEPVALSPADGAGRRDDRTTAFCSACHAMPRPESFPKSAWKKEVQRGFDFYLQSRRTDLVAPVQERAVAYFRARAPERLALPHPVSARQPSRLLFRAEDLKPEGTQVAPATSHLHAIRLDSGDRPSLVYCDMENGEVGAVSFREGQPMLSLIATLAFPCHTE